MLNRLDHVGQAAGAADQDLVVDLSVNRLLELSPIQRHKQAVIVGVLLKEIEIGPRQLSEPGHRRQGPVGRIGSLKPLDQQDEAFLQQRRQQSLFALKIEIDRPLADLGRRCHVVHRRVRDPLAETDRSGSIQDGGPPLPALPLPAVFGWG